MKRLICLVRGHRWVRVIERVELESATPFGAMFRIKVARNVCQRCGTRSHR